VRVAALFVAKNGPYILREYVDAWTIKDDARNYSGPYPVVAHPPCARYSRYWSGGPSARRRRKKGEDGGCFASALMAVRNYGGVLEHPADSWAWPLYGLRKPPRSGGWVKADDFGGITCYVEQGHYGHRARKGTWLYACHTFPIDLKWGPAPQGLRLDEGFHSTEERKLARSSGKKPLPRLSERERELTPELFARLLLHMARTTRIGINT
jgi:hypothetical protein